MDLSMVTFDDIIEYFREIIESILNFFSFDGSITIGDITIKRVPNEHEE